MRKKNAKRPNLGGYRPGAGRKNQYNLAVQYWARIDDSLEKVLIEMLGASETISHPARRLIARAIESGNNQPKGTIPRPGAIGLTFKVSPEMAAQIEGARLPSEKTSALIRRLLQLGIEAQ